jgi:hypothetical protein
MPKEIPILFQTAMVHAILDGRKSMTRRIIKPQGNIFEPQPDWTGVVKKMDDAVHHLENNKFSQKNLDKHRQKFTGI